MKPVEFGIGIFLIAFAFLIFIYALPSLSSATSTGTGQRWENGTTTQKASLNFTNSYVFIMPIFIFFVGFALTWKGVAG